MPINRLCGYLYEKVSPLSQIKGVQEVWILLLLSCTIEYYVSIQSIKKRVDGISKQVDKLTR